MELRAMRDEELGMGVVSGSPPPAGAEAKVSELIRSMLAMKAGPDGSGVSEETRSALSRLSTAVEYERDVSRPIGRVRRAVLTTVEFSHLDRADGGVPSGELLSRLGLPGDVRIVLWEPRVAAGCYDCVIWSSGFGMVSFGEAVPLHVIRPAAPAPAPSPPPAASPVPEGIS